MFINREQELQTLNQEYQKDAAAFTVIYGRRRVGKTALISAYIQDKPSVYYYSTETKIPQQLQQLTSQILGFLNKSYLNTLNFSDFEQLLVFFADQLPSDKKVVFVIDEYQELVKLLPDFSSMLQKVWDLHLQSRRIHLILCGSVLSMMHSETLSYSSPLYGRRTSNIHLKPMKFRHIQDFIPGISALDAMNIYTSFGTIPKYLELYDQQKDFFSNLEQNILNKDAYLYEEGRFLLKEELGSGPTYFSILQTIALGETKLGAIAKRLQVPSNHLSRYLLKLIEMGILEKETPVTEKNPLTCKLGRYRICDQFVQFWFRYVYRNASLLEIGQIRYVMEEIRDTFNRRFVARAYEDVVKEIILEKPEKYLGFIPLKIGRWWNNKEEIDLVAFNDEKLACIECKWQNRPIGYDVYQKLVEKAQLIESTLPHNYLIFSKSGFKDSLLNVKNVKLYAYPTKTHFPFS